MAPFPKSNVINFATTLKSLKFQQVRGTAQAHILTSSSGHANHGLYHVKYFKTSVFKSVTAKQNKIHTHTHLFFYCKLLKSLSYSFLTEQVCMITTVTQTSQHPPVQYQPLGPLSVLPPFSCDSTNQTFQQQML